MVQTRLTAVLTKISSENCCSRDHQLTYARSANSKNCSKSTRPFSTLEWVGSGHETTLLSMLRSSEFSDSLNVCRFRFSHFSACANDPPPAFGGQGIKPGIIIIIIILINAPMQVHGEGKGERWKMKWHYIHDKLFTTESASGSEGFEQTYLMTFE